MTATVPAIDDTAQMLGGLGVTDSELTDEQRATLDRDGFLRLPGVMDDEWLTAIRTRLSELEELEGAAAGHEAGRQPTATMLADLFNKGEMFERMLRFRPVLAAAAHVLGDFKINSLNARIAPPGQGDQALHSDCGLPRADGYRLCNSMWMVDDFTTTNGATRAVVGSHTAGRLPSDAMTDPSTDHPDQQLLTGAAGDVIVFNAHLWHSGTHNGAELPRRGLTLSFCRRDEPQQTDQAEHIRKRVYDRLSPAERFLLDV